MDWCFLGGGSLLLLARIFSCRSGFILDSRGILEDASLFPTGMIFWNEISGYRLISFQHQTFLVVCLESSDAFIARLHPVCRILCRYTTNLIGTPVAFGTSGLRISAEELLRLCTEHLEHHRQAAGNGVVQRIFRNTMSHSRHTGVYSIVG